MTYLSRARSNPNIKRDAGPSPEWAAVATRESKQEAYEYYADLCLWEGLEAKHINKYHNEIPLSIT